MAEENQVTDTVEQTAQPKEKKPKPSRRQFLKKAAGYTFAAVGTAIMSVGALNALKYQSERDRAEAEARTKTMSVEDISNLSLQKVDELAGTHIRTQGWVEYLGRHLEEIPWITSPTNTGWARKTSADVFRLHGKEDLSDKPVVLIVNAQALIPRIDNLPEVRNVEGQEVILVGSLQRSESVEGINRTALDKFNISEPYYLSSKAIVSKFPEGTK